MHGLVIVVAPRDACDVLLARHRLERREDTLDAVGVNRVWLQVAARQPRECVPHLELRLVGHRVLLFAVHHVLAFHARERERALFRAIV